MHSALIAKSTAYAAKIGGGTIAGINEINQLADGAIAAFTDDNVLLTAANVAATIPGKKGAYFAVGTGSAAIGARISGFYIPRVAVQKKTEYGAPVAEVQYIGFNGTSGDLNLPTSLVPGTIAILRIQDLNDYSIYPEDMKTYDYTVKAGDTEEDIVDGLVARVNANSISIVTAVKEGVAEPFGIEFTTKIPGNAAAIYVEGIMASATVTSRGSGAPYVAPFRGRGTYAQVSTIENYSDTEDGDTNQTWLRERYFNRPKQAVPGATYDSYIFTWVTDPKVAVGRTPGIPQEYFLYYPDGGTAQANLETILAAVFNQ